MELISSGAEQFRGCCPGPREPHSLCRFFDLRPSYLSAQAHGRGHGPCVQTTDTLLQSSCLALSMLKGSAEFCSFITRAMMISALGLGQEWYFLNFLR